MLKFVPANCNRVLEIGCGQGYFGRELLKRGSIEIWGVEPHYESYLYSTKTYYKVINDFYRKDLELPHNYFDCIIFNDVLEHLIDPLDTLFFTKNYLKRERNSCLVVSIPNFNYVKNLYQVVIKGDFKYEDSGTLDKTHLKFFTKKSIKRLFKDSGYKIEVMQGINPSSHSVFKIFNLITMNALEDMKFLQYALVAKLRDN